MNLQATPTKPTGSRERSLDEVKAEPAELKPLPTYGRKQSDGNQGKLSDVSGPATDARILPLFDELQP